MNEFDTTTVSENKDGLMLDDLVDRSGGVTFTELPKISLEKANMNEYRRFNDTLHAIWGVCKAAGFRLEGRVTLVDKRTGRVWK